MVQHTAGLVSVVLNQPSDRLELQRLCMALPGATFDALPDPQRKSLLDFLATFDRQADRVEGLASLLRALQWRGDYALKALRQLTQLQKILRGVENAKRLKHILTAARAVRNQIDRIHAEANKILEGRPQDATRPPGAGREEAEVTFIILLLTDLHWHLEKSADRWSDVEKPFLDDLRAALNPDRPLDLVMCAGDLAFSGRKEELRSGVDLFFKKLWEVFADCGSRPGFLTVPGNHDLQWPTDKKDKQVLNGLNQFFQREDIREAVLSGKNSPERELIHQSFQEWLEWRQDNLNWQFGQGSLVRGDYQNAGARLPGDFSYRLRKGNRSLGIVGLNSAFLQMGNEDYEQKLALDSGQVHSCCGCSARQWLPENGANILLTHHPSTWFHPSAQEHFWNDICIPGQVDLHLHGHLHAPGYGAVGRQPGVLVHRIQGISLFGEETYFDRKQNEHVQRLHGSVLVQLAIGLGANRFRFRPRVFTPGKRAVAPVDIEADSAGWTHWVTLPKKEDR
jgi:predicted phosphodiesterase